MVHGGIAGHDRGDHRLDVEIRGDEIQDNRSQKSPCHDAAREVERGELGTDDVADTDVGRADLEGGQHHAAGSGDALGTRGEGHFLHAGDARLGEGNEFLPQREEDLELTEGLDECAAEHGAEKELRPTAAAATGLVDFRRRHRLGVRQFGILDHHAPQQGDEHDAEHAAGNEDQRGGDVVRRREKFRPDAGDEERGEREDRAGRHGFTDGADGTRDVLFEDRSLQGLEQGHADNRGRVRGGNGHTGLEAEVCVCRTQHDGENETDEQRAKRKLLHIRVRRDERNMFRLSHTILLSKEMLGSMNASGYS